MCKHSAVQPYGACHCTFIEHVFVFLQAGAAHMHMNSSSSGIRGQDVHHQMERDKLILANTQTTFSTCKETTRAADATSVPFFPFPFSWALPLLSVSDAVSAACVVVPAFTSRSSTFNSPCAAALTPGIESATFTISCSTLLALIDLMTD